MLNRNHHSAVGGTRQRVRSRSGVLAKQAYCGISAPLCRCARRCPMPSIGGPYETHQFHGSHLASRTLLAAALVAPATTGAHPVAEPVLAASVRNSIVWGMQL